MLCLCLLFLSTIFTSGAELRCQKRLDVISYSKWPILHRFSRQLADNAVLVNFGCQFHFIEGNYTGLNRVVLQDWRNKTYLHGLHPDYNVSNGPEETRELVEISGLSVKDIKFGQRFIAILTKDGSVWTAGDNYYGQLSGDKISRPTFGKVQGVPEVTQIATSHWLCIVLTDDGRLFSWGDGAKPTPTSFKLGQGASLPTSICCNAGACMALTEDAEIFTWGSPLYIGRKGEYREPGRVSGIPSEQTIVKVSCGFDHMLALSSSGRIYGWGWNIFGELLQATKHTASATELGLAGVVVRDMVAGNYITIVRTNAEEVYYFGYYDGHENRRATQPAGSLYPRDLMAKTYLGQESRGAVSLGCK